MILQFPFLGSLLKRELFFFFSFCFSFFFFLHFCSHFLLQEMCFLLLVLVAGLCCAQNDPGTKSFKLSDVRIHPLGFSVDAKKGPEPSGIAVVSGHIVYCFDDFICTVAPSLSQKDACVRLTTCPNNDCPKTLDMEGLAADPDREGILYALNEFKAGIFELKLEWPRSGKPFRVEFLNRWTFPDLSDTKDYNAKSGVESIAYLGNLDGRRQFLIGSQLTGQLYEVSVGTRGPQDTFLVGRHRPNYHLFPMTFKPEDYNDVADMFYSPQKGRLYILIDKIDILASFDLILGNSRKPSQLRKNLQYDLRNLKAHVADQEGVTISGGRIFFADDGCRKKANANKMGCLISLPFRE